MKHQRAYKAFRKAYSPMLRAAKRELDTPMQRGLVDAIAQTAFAAGFAAGLGEPQPLQPIVLKPWTTRPSAEPTTT